MICAQFSAHHSMMMIIMRCGLDAAKSGQKNSILNSTSIEVKAKLHLESETFSCLQVSRTHTKLQLLWTE